MSGPWEKYQTGPWTKYAESATQEIAAPERKSTIGSELVRGGKQLVSSIRTGAGALTGSPEEAALAGVARSRAIGEEAGEGASFEAVKKAYQERGLLSAAGEVAGQIPRALAGQVPQLAAMAGTAKLGAMAGAPLGPVGAIGGGILGAGASLLPQFFGSNIERQAAEQLARDEQVKIDRGAAGAAAAGQAAIEGAGTAFVLGKRIVKGVLGVADDAALASAKAQQAMTKAAERSLAAAAGRGIAKGAAVEIPVEIAQSVLERAQAGLDVTSPEALSEYGEVAYQAGLVGGAIGAGAGPVDTAMARQGVKARTAFEEAEAKRLADAERARLEAEAAERAKIPPLALGGEGAFTPVVLPDGSVAMTREELAQYEEQQFQKKYAAQAADKKPTLALGVGEPFKPVVFPDGSVATTPEEVAAYEKQQFEGKYKPQPVPPKPVFQEEPVGKSITGTKPRLEARPAGGELAGIISGRREAEEAKAEIPLADDYAFLQREKQRLLQEPSTPQIKQLIQRIDARMGEVLTQDIERQRAEAEAKKRRERADAEAAKTSVFGRDELPPVERREDVVGQEALANLQAKETPAEMTDFELARAKTVPRKQPRPTTEEDTIAAEQEKELRTLQAERNKIKGGGNLYRALEGQLNASEVNDISPDIKKLYGKGFKPLVRPGGQGTDISELVDDGLLNNFLPDAMKKGAENYDVQESAEYIKNKLRTKDTRAEVSTKRTRELDEKISYLSNVVGERERVAKTLAEIEPGEAATIERAVGDQAVVETTDQIRYKRATGKVGIGKQAVQDTVDAVKSRWANAPEVVVAENMDDPAIPQEVRDHNKEAIAKGAKGSPQGFYYKGKAYVIADSIGSTNDAVEALMHEALGHFGLRGVFGSKMEAVLRDVVKNRRAEVEAKAKQYGLDPKSDKDMLEAAEEVLAVMAQTKPGLPFVKRAIAIIRNFLRDLGFDIKMSDADIIQKYILPARAFVESGKGRTVEGGVSAMRGQPAPSWVPEKIWRLHELMQRADDEAEGRVPLRESEQGKVPTSGALKRNQTMTFRRLNAAVDEYVGGDYQKSMDLMTRMNEESNRRADEVESRPAAMRGEAPKTGRATEAFDRWFGNSKVVDESGNPLVVSHITKVKGINVFDPNYKTELSSMGFHFGSKDQAEFRGKQYDFKSKGEPEVGQYYLSIKNPLRVSHMASYAPDHLADQMMDMGVLDEDAYADIQSEAKYDSVETGDRLVNILKDQGYDGLVYENEKEGEGDSFVPFEPTQIKSATGNIGTYDPKNADIRYSRQNIKGQPILAQWTTPTDTKLYGDTNKDDIIYSLQNKMIDTKRVVDAISATAGKIMAKWNPYLQEELFHGRTAKQTGDFLKKELRPLMQDMSARGVNIKDFEEYLHNRHAEDYNKHVAKINPNMPDGGSGIDTADARAYLKSLTPQQKADFEALAKRMDAINKGTREVLVEGGLETRDLINQWEKTFPFYVPLKRDDLDYAYTAGGMGTGQGFDVRGNFSRRATGSERNVVDILANTAMQRERAIIKAEKNRVAQAMFGLAVQSPNPDFWLPIDPMAEVDPAAAQDLLSFGLSQQDLDFLMKEPRQKAVDKNSGQVVERINATLRNNENVMSMRFNGRDRYVFFNPNNPRSKRMISSLKNLDADQLGYILGNLSKVTRWFASVNTQYNPIFGAYNFLRDVQGAALQLSDTPLAKDRKAVVSGTLPALKGIYSALRAERDGQVVNTPWAKLWNEFQEEGGQTGFRDQFSRSQERAEALEKELKMVTEGKLKSAGRATLDWLSDYNDSMENAVRLSAYKAALDRGINKQEAASIAKNLTVNFNRKGQIAVQAGALYAFFNAAVQGTTRLAQTLRGPAGKKIMAGGLLLGTMQAALLAAAGFDDEEPPEFVRERNLILPIGGDKYLTFPMPLGYHVIPSTSRIITEWALSGFKDTGDRIASLTGMFLEAFNPIGNAGWSAQTLAPTFADPIVALTENRDWTGKPIAKKDFANTDPTPGYTRAKDTASWFSTQLAKFLNYASDGTEFQPGVLSPTPDQIDYLIGQVTGGIGRELLKAEQTITKTATGEELPPYKIPVVGRFYGETKSSAAESNRFYKNLTELNKLENEIKGRREKRQPIGDFLKENPEARLAPMARKTQEDIQKLRKRKEQLLERDAPRESIKQVELMMTKKMQAFNARVEAAKE
jgi:hypothetical protein